MSKRLTQSQWDAKRAEAKAKALEALQRDVKELVPDVLDGGHGTTGEDTDGYAEWSDEELLEEASNRGLEHDGTRESIIEGLEADDDQAE